MLASASICGASEDQAGSETIGHALAGLAASQPESAAIVSSEFEPLSYRNLQAQIAAAGASLRAAGLGEDARIAVVLPPGPHAALAITAICCCAVAVPLNPRHAPDEFDTLLRSVRANAVLVGHDGASAARSAAQRQNIPVIDAVPASDGTLGLTLRMPRIAPAAAPVGPWATAPAFILQSSGTTAAPKLIPFTHANMLAAAARLRSWFDLTPADRCLSVSPPYYSHGLKVTILTPLLTGGTVTFPTDPTRFDLFEWFGSLRPTWYSAGPTLHRLVLDQSRARPAAKSLHALRFILSGGAPLPAEVREGLAEALGVPVVEHYGSSEAAQIATNRPAPGLARPGTAGIPWPGTLMVVDDEGKPVPAGRPGEVLVRGPTVMGGYLDAPDLNLASFVDGWLRTGDLGSLDEDGFLSLHGRLKDVINRGGEKIAPNEIDEALQRHPAIAEAAAFAVAHPRLGEDVAAAVVVRPGATVTADELRAYLDERLAPFKVPRRIHFVEALPKGATGKVLRRLLAETIAQQSPTPVPAVAEDGAEDLSARLITIFERLLGSAPVTIDDDFFDKGGDSLLAVQLLVEIEQLTGSAVPAPVLFEAPTIRKLVRVLGDGKGPRNGTVMTISGGEPALPRRAPPQSGSPLIYCHGDPLGGYYTRKLAAVLGHEQKLIVVNPHGFDNAPMPPTVEAMAADRLPAILEAQPRGPYRLAGYCVGGLVAFELARLLRARGERVEWVAMVDPPTINAQPAAGMLLAAMGRLCKLGGASAERALAWSWVYLTKLEKLVALSPGRRNAWLRSRLRDPLQRRRHLLDAPAAPGPARATAAARNDPTPFERYAMAMARYLPKPLDVRVVYFGADFLGKAWRHVSPDLQVIRLSSDHVGVPQDPAELGGHLRTLLEPSAPRGAADSAHASAGPGSSPDARTGREPGNIVYDAAMAYQKTAALVAAVKLDLFTVIGSSALTAEDVAAGTGASTRGIRILCDFLTVMGLLTKRSARYSLTQAASTLLDGASALAMGGIVDFVAAPEMIRLLLDDPASYVRRGGAAGLSNTAPDNPVWERFARAMVPFARATAQRVAVQVGSLCAPECNVLDIAAGHGLYGIEIAKALPKATVTAIDWAAVLTVARAHAEQAGVFGRFRMIAGNALELDWDGRYDLILLPNFLHHFDYGTCVSLLRKARGHLRDGGLVLIVDFVPDEDRVGPPVPAMFAFWMLASTPGGDAHTAADYDAMARDAGYRATRAHPLVPTPQTMIVLEA